MITKRKRSCRDKVSTTALFIYLDLINASSGSASIFDIHFADLF